MPAPKQVAPETVARIPAFSAMPEAALRALIESGEPQTHDVGARLVTQGEASAFALLLLEGDVSIVNESAHGAIPIARIGAPALIGEIGALADLPRTASIFAASPVSVLRIDRAPLRAAFAQAPDMLASVVGQLGAQIRNVNDALGLFAGGFAALERGDLDEALARDLKNPSGALQDFVTAFDRLAKRIATERRMRTDMASAALIQRQMLPQGVQHAPALDRCDVFGDMRAAKDVGGDLFDIIPLDDHRIAFCVGDVCGKGVPASLFMCVTVTMLRLAAREAASLADMMEKVNAQLFAQNPTSMFSTLFYGVLDVRTGVFDYVNCGHNPPYLLRGGACAPLLESGGPPVGILPSKRWPAARMTLRPGDALFLFTDGVTEAIDTAGAEYGEARLEATLSAAAGGDAKSLVETVMADVDRFAGGADPFDDVTCVACVFP